MNFKYGDEVLLTLTNGKQVTVKIMRRAEVEGYYWAWRDGEYLVHEKDLSLPDPDPSWFDLERTADD